MRADRELALGIDTTAAEIMKRVTAVENEMRGVYQQQAEKLKEMDEAASKWLVDVEGKLATLKAKIDTVALGLKAERADRGDVGDKLADLNAEFAELAETVQKLEFPEFEKIDVSLED